MVQVKFNKTVDIDHIREGLEPLSENLMVQKLLGTEEYIVRMEVPEEGADKLSPRIQDLLDKEFGKGNSEIRSVEMVGPKVGKDLQTSAIWATIIALGMLLVYMAFRFTFTMGLGAVFCLVHDLSIVYGFFAWTGKEFNLTILAAMLTVIGYDINDTIVVCDRIRENLTIMKKAPLLTSSIRHKPDAFQNRSHQLRHAAFRHRISGPGDPCPAGFRVGAGDWYHIRDIFIHIRRFSGGVGTRSGPTR